MKIRYKKPKIMRIELDPKQALLQVCSIGGLYMAFGSGGTACVGAGGTDAHWPCGTPVRGHSSTLAEHDGRFVSAPS